MNEHLNAVQEQIRKEIREIVASGKDMQIRVAQVVARATARAQEGADDFVSIWKAVHTGAAEGMRQANDAQQEGAWREVLDGLGDGLEASANAMRLTIEEARSKGEQFAQSDLEKIRPDVRALNGLFKETAREAAKKIYLHGAAQAQSVCEHAIIAARRAQASFDRALDAAIADPKAVAGGAYTAGKTAFTRATGTLFEEVGKRMTNLGGKLKS